jgi:DedD protein
LNQNTRQRLTGTLVLALAALILLPVIFDGEGSYQPVLQTDIPDRPARPVPARTDPQRPVITADSDAILINDVPDTGAPAVTDTNADSDSASSSAPATAATPTPVADRQDSQVPPEPDAEQPPVSAPVVAGSATTSATTSAATAANSSPTLDNQGLPQGFSVRLGSFGNASNASNLVTRLQDAGHRAYTRRIDSSQGALTAVFVGPVVDRAAASTLLEELRGAFQLNGMIVRYEIEQL